MEETLSVGGKTGVIRQLAKMITSSDVCHLAVVKPFLLRFLLSIKASEFIYTKAASKVELFIKTSSSSTFQSIFSSFILSSIAIVMVNRMKKKNYKKANKLFRDLFRQFTFSIFCYH